jgi:uncharacterized protein (TIGR04255 family)
MAVDIVTGEKFPHLKRAPITEAVIEVRGRAGTPWDETQIRTALVDELPDYPNHTDERELSSAFSFAPGTPSPLSPTVDLSWKGLRFRSSDQTRIGTFFRDLFAFSQLAPYPDWKTFSNEGLRLFQIYLKVAKPPSADRLGVRFINRVKIAPNGHLENYLVAPPREASGLKLPLTGFLHIDNSIVPGHPYGINFVRTLQVSPDVKNPTPALIIDIDVFTLQPFTIELAVIEAHLENMRWLKNKLFFGNITKSMLNSFQ